jgi:hypothetical protein
VWDADEDITVYRMDVSWNLIYLTVSLGIGLLSVVYCKYLFNQKKRNENSSFGMERQYRLQGTIDETASLLNK